jgi:hypothetical protein
LILVLLLLLLLELEERNGGGRIWLGLNDAAGQILQLLLQACKFSKSESVG